MTPRPADLADADAPLGGDDLAWLAFRYVAGELPEAASAAFEMRLDGDQATREAVAEAVALVSALAGAPRPAGLTLVVEAGEPRRRPRLRAAGMLAGLAAAAALVALPWLGTLPTGAGRGDADLRTLALTWSGLWQAGDADADLHPDDAPQWPTPVDEPAADRSDALVAWIAESNAPGPDVAADPDDETPGPPPWMLEAASLARPGS